MKSKRILWTLAISLEIDFKAFGFDTLRTQTKPQTAFA